MNSPATGRVIQWLLLVGMVLAGPGLVAASSGTEWRPEELNWHGISQRRVNDVRVDSGLPALKTDGYLGSLAQERARDMAERGYLGATTPEGVDSGAYMRQDGARFDRWFELRAEHSGDESDSDASWMVINGFLNEAQARLVMVADIDRFGSGLASKNGRRVFVILMAKASPPPTPTPKPATPVPAGVALSTPQIIEIIIAAARRHGVDPNWLVKIARCESGFNPRAYNPAGPYIGLFQFLPATYYANGGKDLYNPYEQSEIAARMISRGMASHWGCA